MKTPAKLFDTALTLCAVFLLSVMLLGYFAHGVMLCLCSAVAALAVTYCAAGVRRKRELPARKKKRLQQLLNKFLFSPRAYAYDFTLAALRNKCEPKEENGLLLTKSTAFCVWLTPEKIPQSALADFYGRATQLPVRKLVFLSAVGAEKEAAETSSLLQNPAVEIWEWEKVYAFFAALGHPPTETLTLGKPSKRTARALLTGALKRENARRYLFTAVVTLLFARFMPYAVLYIVVSATALVLGVLCLFSPLFFRHDR